jgi:addiction module HigA family antidote
MRMFEPPHPGEVLRDFLGETSISTAAAHLGVSRATLSRVLNGHHGISAKMALRLGEASERRKPILPLFKLAA